MDSTYISSVVASWYTPNSPRFYAALEYLQYSKTVADRLKLPCFASFSFYASRRSVFYASNNSRTLQA